MNCCTLGELLFLPLERSTLGNIKNRVMSVKTICNFVTLAMLWPVTIKVPPWRTLNTDHSVHQTIQFGRELSGLLSVMRFLYLWPHHINSHGKDCGWLLILLKITERHQLENTSMIKLYWLWSNSYSVDGWRFFMLSLFFLWVIYRFNQIYTYNLIQCHISCTCMCC